MSTRNGVKQKIQGHLSVETYEQEEIYNIQGEWTAVSNDDYENERGERNVRRKTS